MNGPRFSLPKLRAARLMLIRDDSGCAEIDRALFDAIAGGRFWPEYAALWREAGAWREPLEFSREEGDAIALFNFALPRHHWLMRSDACGAFANVYPRVGADYACGANGVYAATAPMALCNSTIVALIAKQEARGA
jgi:hypothetical protein